MREEITKHPTDPVDPVNSMMMVVADASTPTIRALAYRDPGSPAKSLVIAANEDAVVRMADALRKGGEEGMAKMLADALAGSFKLPPGLKLS